MERLPPAVAHAVAPPLGAGGADDLIGTEFDCLIGVELALKIELYIRHLGNLRQAPVAHPAPGGKAGQAAFAGDAAARFICPIGDGHLIAALTERTSRFEARRPGADDQDMFVAVSRPDALGMPAAPPLFAH